MSTTLFERNILDLNFSFISEEEEGGVLLTKSLENIKKRVATPDVLFGLEKAKKFEADAAYFRYFQDGRAAVPQLYFFDYTQKPLSDEDRNKIHVRMWNGYEIPAYVIIQKSQVLLFDSRSKPDKDNARYAEEIIIKTGNAIKDFNAQGFYDGLFWEEQDEKKSFKFEQSATRDLIRGLKAVYKSFQQKSNLDKHVALKLLVQSLLIKYLEERDEDSASGYFAGTYFKRNFQCASFCDTIRNGKLLDLLDKLASDFNGKIFEWSKKTEQAERAAIQNTKVNQLADYLDGNIQDSQYVLWRLYSFSYLPVEVISSVYEELLTDSKDIVYTPEMIVSTLVDECMPLKTPQQNFKLIDVSCGSGIFLVKAYKRIVQWWRYEQWVVTGTLPKPSLAVLKELLLKSIHGVDIQQDAIRLSIFSLALAILDEVNLDPPTWGKLKFPDLSENIITKDFFEFITNNPAQDFDLVIGNPPFNLQPVNGKEPSRKKYFEQLKKNTGYKSEISIPDENPALHFLVHSMKLLRPAGLLCMIQPSGPLFYQKDTAFKQNVFSQYNLLQVIDLTKLADKLWGKTNVATAAIFLQKANPDNNEVLHLIANRTFSNTNRLFLEFDHYDFLHATKDEVLNNPYVWKANILGGRRIVSLINKLSGLRTIEDFVLSKETVGWKAGEGFIASENGKECEYITNKDFLPTEAFTEKGIDWKKVYKIQTKKFHRPTNKKIYTPPHILIKANIGREKLLVFFSDRYLVFKDKIIGIHAPIGSKSELINLHSYLEENSSILRFYIACTSGQVSVNRATAIIKDDLMTLPYPEQVNDVRLSRADKILVDDILSFHLGKSEKKLMNDGTELQVQKFSEVFCQALNSIYESNNKSFKLFKLLDAGKYYALHFEYTDEKLESTTENNDDLENYIQEIIPSNNNRQKTHIQRIMKAYGQDTIILVKPKQLRYWLPSIALRDADESFADYVKARYPNA